jgi:hypothetical protein
MEKPAKISMENIINPAMRVRLTILPTFAHIFVTESLFL